VSVKLLLINLRVFYNILDGVYWEGKALF